MSGNPSWARRAIRRIRPALPARALRAVSTASTHRPLLVVAAGDRLDHTASAAGRSERPARRSRGARDERLRRESSRCPDCRGAVTRVHVGRLGLP